MSNEATMRVLVWMCLPPLPQITWFFNRSATFGGSGRKPSGKHCSLFRYLLQHSVVWWFIKRFISIILLILLLVSFLFLILFILMVFLFFPSGLYWLTRSAKAWSASMSFCSKFWALLSRFAMLDKYVTMVVCTILWAQTECSPV